MAPPTKSGWYTETFLAALGNAVDVQTGTPTVISLTGEDANLKLSLYSSLASDGSAPLVFSSATPGWANTFEVTGTGWVTGGVQLSTAAGGSSVASALTQFGSSPYGVQYSWGSALSVPSTTLSAVYGCIVYFPSITAGTGLNVSKPMLLSLCFGTAYATVAGTFGITPSGSGLSQLTLTQ
jgi:hypothetical protein